MNKARREAIDKLIERAVELRGEIEAVLEEEQEYLDNMPDSFRDGEKGQAVEGNILCLEGAVENLTEAEENLDSAKGN